MCLIIFAYDILPDYHLVLAANRDEFYNRPTAAANFWEPESKILAGQDLEMLGTWMGITRAGRFAALTNFRDPASQIKNPRSRGFLVRDFLRSEEPPQRYLENVNHTQSLYNPFNLLAGDLSCLMYFSNQGPVVRDLKPGYYGLSNHFLDTPWPKVQKSKDALINYLELNPEGLIAPESLFEILADTNPAQDEELPDTGISRDREKILSPIFIAGKDYGTRSSTVLLLDRKQNVFFQERSFYGNSKSWREVIYQFKLDT
ncbi:hypothetical protein DEAC_c26270 [Desulfosporosinus acididurans]|uniref:NRDE family protein n=1 Tax=Desulfosporosinus acididurans TaxID=476652 RepID=A0A0J1FPS5_9FIRM|nr:NRDE family protein [Desulfosporosinus acididurans]KLU65490.1 hypothetical protein DEAC_c26270 [Desulfosporosinus acididurans]